MSDLVGLRALIATILPTKPNLDRFDEIRCRSEALFYLWLFPRLHVYPSSGARAENPGSHARG